MFLILGKSQKYFSLRQKELGALNGHIEVTSESGNSQIYTININRKEKIEAYLESLSIKNNKLYIATFDENKLVATINGEEKTLYKSEELAYEYKFMSDNGLSEQEYNELYKLNFDEKYFINVKEFLTIYKGKSKKKVVLVSNSYNYKNILDYVKLSKILDDSYKLIAIDSLSESDLQSLFNKIGITDYDNNLVTVYLVGNKNTSISEVLDIKNIKEI